MHRSSIACLCGGALLSDCAPLIIATFSFSPSQESAMSSLSREHQV